MHHFNCLVVVVMRPRLWTMLVHIAYWSIFLNWTICNSNAWYTFTNCWHSIITVVVHCSPNVRPVIWMFFHLFLAVNRFDLASVNRQMQCQMHLSYFVVNMNVFFFSLLFRVFVSTYAPKSPFFSCLIWFVHCLANVWAFNFKLYFYIFPSISFPKEEGNYFW